MRVKDDSGNIVSGILKATDGVLIAEAGSDYNKYLQEKQRVEQINNLTKQVEDLNNLVKQLLSKNQQEN